MATCPSIAAARLAFCLCFICFISVLFVLVFSGEPKQNQGRGLVDRKLHVVQAPSNYIASRPKAALLFWFFSDFICGVLLFIVLLVIYEYKNK